MRPSRSQRPLPESWQAVAYLPHPDVSSWTFSSAHGNRLERRCPDITCTVCTEPRQFREALPAAHIAMVWKISDEELALAPDIRILSTPAAGRDYFRVNLPPGVVTFHGRFHGPLMAETAAAMVLGMTRGLLPAVTEHADKLWPRREMAQCMRPLRGSRVLVLGFGHIGRAVARALKPFGVHITGVKRTVTASMRPDFFEVGDRLHPVEELDGLLPHTDHLILILPGGTATDHLLDARRLGLLPRHATLTNLGRGNALDHDALLNALHNRDLAGACLDVFPREPLPADSPLRHCPNLWRMPHASAVSPNYLDLFVDDFVLQFERWRRRANQA